MTHNKWANIESLLALKHNRFTTKCVFLYIYVVTETSLE